MNVRCPTCKTNVEWSAKNPCRPFCSERCRLIDLGAWASEDYRVAAEPAVIGDAASSSGDDTSLFPLN